MTIFAKAIAAAFALSLVLGVTGCSNQSDTANALHSEETRMNLSASSLDILGMYKGTSVDVNLVADPDLLTGQAKAVIEGEISSFSRGREWQFGGPDNASSYSTVMEVIVTKVYKGTGLMPGAKVYVEHFLALDVTIESLNSTLVGFKCGLFLIPAAADGYAALVDSHAGRPLGEPLWVSGAQTFVVQDKTNQQVVWPQLDEVRQGDLNDAMPGGSLTPLTR
jgi:hypothetical protein